jgi:putative DNA primase/helicase
MFARALDGVGFVFTRDDPFCGVDLDHCFSNGELNDNSRQLVHSLNSYTEYSPSRKGIHILVQAQLNGGPHRAGGIEIYDSRRYFTFTGEHLPSSPFAVLSRQPEILRLQESLRPSIIGAATDPVIHLNRDRSDDAVLQRALRAGNGARFARLWAGDASDYGNDRSRADAALCALLALHTGGCGEQMDRLFCR